MILKEQESLAANIEVGSRPFQPSPAALQHDLFGLVREILFGIHQFKLRHFLLGFFVTVCGVPQVELASRQAVRRGVLFVMLQFGRGDVQILLGLGDLVLVLDVAVLGSEAGFGVLLTRDIQLARHAVALGDLLCLTVCRFLVLGLRILVVLLLGLRALTVLLLLSNSGDFVARCCGAVARDQRECQGQQSDHEDARTELRVHGSTPWIYEQQIARSSKSILPGNEVE